MIEDIIKVRDKVGYVLEKYPETRDSDKVLWLAYMCVFGGLRNCFSGRNAYDVFRNLILDKDTPTFESLTRVRRKFQEKGLFVGTKRMEKLEQAGAVSDWALNN